jgi:hypothetical protein
MPVLKQQNLGLHGRAGNVYMAEGCLKKEFQACMPMMVYYVVNMI